MKIEAEKIIYPIRNSFKILKYSVPQFEMPFHYHPEYELVYISKGSGKRYIGNSIHNFQSGDMVFIGADLAHIWVNEKEVKTEVDDQIVEAVVLQFSKDLLDSLIDTPEFIKIKKLFNRARSGLKIIGPTQQNIVKKLEELLICQGVERILCLIHMLDILARSKDLIPLNPVDFNPGAYHDDERINAVHHYVISRYQYKIFINEAASLAHMEKSAFCRFFKMKTQKTFTRFVNETRIDHACRLLLENRLSVSQIAFEVGFNNLANFYRQFMKITGQTPGDYKSHR
ncbi:MAG: AraC family transcriptional regulator [Candidatus Marinimicrobia bacterium]|nr:AraC family transcriptional regulator [Candidatus Neomarinimicrobiota bacterium]